LGSRLRRASERLEHDGVRVYAAHNVRFKQRWYGILNKLVLNGPMAIGAIAEVLRVSQVSVSQASRFRSQWAVLFADWFDLAPEKRIPC
jgi:hypothetical protein